MNTLRLYEVGFLAARNIDGGGTAGGSGGGGGSGSGVGTTWTSRTSQSKSLNGVAYGNGLFVAVGGHAGYGPSVSPILTSPDGVNWTAQTSPTSAWLFSLTYGNGLFVAVGVYGTILTSP